MGVANELIGSIIGKGGSKIAEIRQMSGANIQISKSADKEPTAERQIQITGNSSVDPDRDKIRIHKNAPKLYPNTSSKKFKIIFYTLNSELS